MKRLSCFIKCKSGKPRTPQSWASDSVTPDEMKLALQDSYARMDAALRVGNAAGEFDFVGSTGIVVMVNHPENEQEAPGEFFFRVVHHQKQNQSFSLF